MPDPTASSPTDDDARDDDRSAWDDEPANLPARSRRRLVTSFTLGLGAVAIAAAGFVGGVQVQKHQANGGGTAARGGFAAAGGSAAGGGARGGARGGGQAAAGNGAQGGAGAAGAVGGAPGDAAAGGGAGGGAGLTVGTVSSKDGAVLYVKAADGTVVKVTTTSTSKVTRNAAASVKGIYPGDTVLVQGTTSSSGTVKATQVTATSKSAAAAGGSFGRPGGGAGFGGAGAAGGPPSP